MAEKRNGWVKYWRKSERNDLYFAEPFDKWHAWMDLVLMANPPDGSKGKPGHLKTSLEALKIRWSWGSRKKVTNFMEHLKAHLMIDFKTIKGNDGGTLVIIKNFDIYQSNKKGSKNGKKKTEGTLKSTTRRNTYSLPKGREKEVVLLESSPEGDSKTTSEKKTDGEVMTPAALFRQMKQEARAKDGSV